jgi:WD40 repeat protein
VGASVGLVVLSKALAKSEQAEQATEKELIATMVAKARGISLSRRSGQRVESLAVLAEATRRARRLDLPPEKFLELRNAAILALALPDLHVGQSWDGFPRGSVAVTFDDDLTIYTRINQRGDCEVRRVVDDQLLYPLPATPLSAEGFRGAGHLLSPDGRFLAVRYGDDSLQLWRLQGSQPDRLLSEKDVTWMDFHPGGRQIALGHTGGDISLHDLGPAESPPGGRLLRRFSTGISGRPFLVIHPNGSLVAIASNTDRVVQIRHLGPDKAPQSLLLPTTISRLAWHPGGQILAVGDGMGSDILLFEGPPWRHLRTLPGPGQSARLAFNHSGDRLVAYSYHGELQLFEMPSGQLLFQTPAQVPTRPQFSRDGRRLACEASDQRLGIWAVADGCEYRTFRHQGATAGTAYVYGEVAPDNRLLAVQWPDGIQFWDLETGHWLGRLPPQILGMPHFVPAGPQAPHGTPACLMTGGRPALLRWPLTARPEAPGPGNPGGVLYRIGPPETLAPHSVLCTGHSSDGQVLVACAGVTLDQHRPFAGGWIFRLDRLGSPLSLDRGRNVTNIAISPDGRWAATSVRPAGPVKVWNAQDGRLVKELTAWDGLFPRFSPDGRQLTVHGDPGPGGAYSTQTWEPTFRFNGRGLTSPDSRLLATETGRGVIQLLDAASGQEVARLEDPNQEVSFYHLFTPDGTRLVTFSNGRAAGIHVWDLRAIRRQLKEMGLDWKGPDYPPEPPPSRLRIEVVP